MTVHMCIAKRQKNDFKPHNFFFSLFFFFSPLLFFNFYENASIYLLPVIFSPFLFFYLLAVSSLPFWTRLLSRAPSYSHLATIFIRLAPSSNPIPDELMIEKEKVREMTEEMERTIQELNFEVWWYHPPRWIFVSSILCFVSFCPRAGSGSVPRHDSGGLLQRAECGGRMHHF